VIPSTLVSTYQLTTRTHIEILFHQVTYLFIFAFRLLVKLMLEEALDLSAFTEPRKLVMSYLGAIDSEAEIVCIPIVKLRSDKRRKRKKHPSHHAIFSLRVFGDFGFSVCGSGLVA